MRTKKYKVGDRIFFEDFRGNIHTDIVIGIKEDSYLDDGGKEVKYRWLKTWEEGNCSCGIEDYNCVSPTNPKCRELAKQYAKFDKQKDEIVNSIMKIISPFESLLQKNIIELLKIKIKQNG